MNESNMAAIFKMAAGENIGMLVMLIYHRLLYDLAK